MSKWESNTEELYVWTHLSPPPREVEDYKLTLVLTRISGAGPCEGLESLNEMLERPSVRGLN